MRVSSPSSGTAPAPHPKPHTLSVVRLFLWLIQAGSGLRGRKSWFTVGRYLSTLHMARSLFCTLPEKALGQRCSSLLALALLMLSFLTCITISAPAHGQEPVLLTIDQAHLDSRTSGRNVYLPHTLAPDDFLAKGSLVNYMLSVDLAARPSQSLGIYVSKMSLSGRVSVNGHEIGGCDIGPLSELRCLNKPQLFVVPASLWQSGRNTVNFEIWATEGQVNGLSQVRVGPAAYLHDRFFAPAYLARVELPGALIPVALLMGILGLIVGLILRNEPAFFMFGLCSIFHAMGLLNHVVSRPSIDIEVFRWLLFSSRLVASPMGILTLLALFGKLSRWNVLLLGGTALLAPAVLWFSSSPRLPAVIMFIPVLLAMPFLIYQTWRWTLQSPTVQRIVTALMLVIMTFTGIMDWQRLKGDASFDGTYFFPYAYTGLLLSISAVLFSSLATALLQAHRQREQLERSAAERMAYEVTEHIPVGTYTVAFRSQAPWGQFLFASQRFLEIANVSRSALLEDPWCFNSRIHEEDRQSWNDFLVNGEHRRERFSLRFRLQVDHETRWVATEAVARTLPDGSLLYEGVLSDETEKMRARAEAEKIREALRQQEVEHSRVREREQLLRDMHDGFGSQIAAVRMMAEKGRITPEQFSMHLREITADLHLVIDTLGHPDLTLEDALADMHYRLERRLHGGAENQLHWHVEVDGLPALPSRDILNLLRLLQEAINNALKHAHARHIWVEVIYTAADGKLLASVRDDGQGMPESPSRGRGMNNMRHRARELHATLEILQHSPGLEVRVSVPQGSPSALPDRPQSSL